MGNIVIHFEDPKSKVRYSYEITQGYNDYIYDGNYKDMLEDMISKLRENVINFYGKATEE